MIFRDVPLSQLRKHKDYDSHLVVKHILDKKTGLNGFISIHNMNLGPAVGGTRMYKYKSEDDALSDVLKLSRAMTYKCAIAGVPFGGGKGVLIGDPKSPDKSRILDDYAKAIGFLKGKFYTGEDVGISEIDVQNMLKISPFFIGKTKFAGDPSPYAAISVYKCIKTAVDKILKRKSMMGLRVSVKGIGKVGGSLIDLLAKEKVKLYVADIDQTKTSLAVKKYKNIKIVNTEEIQNISADVYSPCAMGNEFNDQNKRNVNAKIICGAANNQLHKSEIAEWFFMHGICYIPDYLANSGGLLNVVDEISPGGYRNTRVLKRIDAVVNRLNSIIDFSDSQNISYNKIADFIAESKFNTTSE